MFLLSPGAFLNKCMHIFYKLRYNNMSYDISPRANALPRSPMDVVNFRDCVYLVIIGLSNYISIPIMFKTTANQIIFRTRFMIFGNDTNTHPHQCTFKPKHIFHKVWRGDYTKPIYLFDAFFK